MSGIGNLTGAMTHVRPASRRVARCERVARVVSLGALTTLIMSCGGGGSSPPPPPPPSPPASVSGTITGLTGTGLTLQLNSANNLTIGPGSTTFSFPPMPAGTNFTVSVSQQPLTPPQTCTVLNPAGTISATMSAISVECTNPSEELIVSGDGNSTVFLVEPTTGRLYPSGVSFALSGGDAGPATDPTGRFLFTAGSSGVYVYTISPSTGAPVAVTGSPFPIGGSPNGLVVDPTGRFLYIGSEGAYAYHIDQGSGALSLIPGSPFAAPLTGLNPREVICQGVCLASASVLYFELWTGAGSFGILGFSIDGTTGALTLNNSVGVSTCCTNADQAVIDPSYKFMYVAQGISGWIVTYAIDGTTGALTQVATTPGSYVTLDSSGAFAYALSAGGGVLMYSRDPTTGILTPLSPTSVAGPVGEGGGQIMFDLIGSFVYVSNIPGSGYNSVLGYSFDASTGLLTAIPGSPFSTSVVPLGMTIVHIP